MRFLNPPFASLDDSEVACEDRCKLLPILSVPDLYINTVSDGNSEDPPKAVILEHHKALELERDVNALVSPP